MKKPVRKKKSSKSKQSELMKRLPKNREEYLELLIVMTERAISNEENQKFLTDQADRLRLELQECKKTNK